MNILQSVNEDTVINVGDQIYHWTVLQVNPRGSYLCRCQCGTERIIKRSVLIKGDSKSCGCMYHVKDISNQTFGELTPIKYVGNKKWLCRCSCGKELEVASYSLTQGKVTSCGHSGIKGKTKDLRGMQFGELTAIEYKGDSMWLCRCSCGKEKIIHRYSLLAGKTKSCGHLSKDKRDKLEGMTFGSLTVLEYIGYKHYKCKCSCGNIITVWGTNLKNGHTKSCGCKTKEIMFSTMLNRYGDITSWKINNPRENWVIETFNTQDKLKYFLESYNEEFGFKPTLTELGDILSVHRTAVKTRLEKFELLEYIDNTSGSSDTEMQLYNYIADICKKKGYCVEKGNRSVLNGKELDIYIPELNIAFEYNGSFWHSILFKDKQYHYQKSYDCASKGIRLIHIFDYELWDKQSKNRIMHYIDNLIDNKYNIIAGRKTIVKMVEPYESKTFLELYHIQGSVNSTINIGLYYNDELIGLMSFGTPRFYTGAEYELLRLCWKHGYRVIGGANKLFKYFTSVYTPNTVVTYCDISKFTGKVYYELGFNYDSTTEPNYKWVDTYKQQSLSRYQTMKSKLVALGLGSNDESENDIMSDLGYVKVYDCGNNRYIWKYK